MLVQSLVSNIVDLSRIEAEALEWNHIVFDLYKMVRLPWHPHGKNKQMIG